MRDRSVVGLIARSAELLAIVVVVLIVTEVALAVFHGH
jgi:hypothetical protein